MASCSSGILVGGVDELVGKDQIVVLPSYCIAMKSAFQIIDT